MLIHLHSQATTTPKIRAAIQASDEPAWVLADRFGTTEQTVWKWRKRDSVHDRSHTAHRLQTTLSPAQEAVAVALRKSLLVSLDDLLAVVREFLNPDVSRSGLDRCLRRHGVGNLRDLRGKTPRPKHSGFKAYEPGYIHIDVKYLPQMADQTSRRYLFVAIDRATRWVFIRIYNNKTAANARRFLRDLERACPMRIRTILTDNGKEFTDRLFGLRKRAQSGKHEFDKLCAVLDIEHRLTPPRSPQTNGMVERFNGRIEDVLQSHHFRSGEELESTLHRYVWLYNQQLPQSALSSKTPLQAMKDWHKLKPGLFRIQPYYRPGCDIYPLEEIFLLVLCAVISGAQGWVSIALYGRKKLNLLRRFLPFEDGTPSHDQLGILFSRLDMEQFQSCFMNWIAGLHDTLEGVIAIDGKTLRRSFDTASGKAAIHMVSAWACEQKLVLGQRKVDDKSNEITAIPELLALLTIKGAIVTIDAMGCQRKICQQIIDQEADYVIGLKGNQGSLRKDVELFFDEHLERGIGGDFIKQSQTVDGDHGRIETRSYTVCTDTGWLKEHHHWPGLKAVIMVEYKREITDHVKTVRQFYIASVDGGTEEMSKYIRSHWQIENCVHWVMDVIFRQDECRIRTGNAAANFATIKHAAMNLLRRAPGKTSLPQKRHSAAWDDDYTPSH